jgi:hypothetical protein
VLMLIKPFLRHRLLGKNKLSYSYEHVWAGVINKCNSDF